MKKKDLNESTLPFFLNTVKHPVTHTQDTNPPPPPKDILTSWAEQGHNRDAKQAGG